MTSANSQPMKHVVSLSGGKDSTALAFALRQREPRDYVYICNPTGNELPEMKAHWEKLGRMLESPLVPVGCGKSLDDLIQIQNALPSWRMRWCTRMLKINPTRQWLARNAPCISYVGLRADEDEQERGGIYGDIADVTFRYPLREWGWTIDDVYSFLAELGIKIPKRTDCAWCYDQRIVEWKNLWREHPELYDLAVQRETQVGNTFRSPRRDKWPASLAEMREHFENERKVRGEKFQLPLWEDVDPKMKKCRVCSL